MKEEVVYDFGVKRTRAVNLIKNNEIDKVTQIEMKELQDQIEQKKQVLQKVRSNGFERPVSLKQVIMWSEYMLTVVVMVLMTALQPYLNVFLISFGYLLVVVVLFYMVQGSYIDGIDPLVKT
jgi:hypothetical protein